MSLKSELSQAAAGSLGGEGVRCQILTQIYGTWRCPKPSLYQPDSVLRHKGIDESDVQLSPAHFKPEQPGDVVTTFP